MNSLKELIVDRIYEEIKDLNIIVFKDGHGLDYKSGQFITLIDKEGKGEIRRSYSMISSPAWSEPLTIAVKRIDNGYLSRKLTDKVKKNDRMLCSGVSGFFQLPDVLDAFSRIYFFAAGSGITPILSLIKSALLLFPKTKLHLIYSNQHIERTAFYNLLKELEKEFVGQLTIDFIFSSSSDLRRARLNREFLLEILSHRGIEPNKTLFYTCGPESYMRMIIFQLIEEGFPKEHIKKEDFNPGNKKIMLRNPPDKKTHSVHLILHGTSYRFTVPYPLSILKAAKNQKIDMPYSCETGKCGSCAAICVTGKVWLSNNEVLTDEDLRKGYTLTCTGHPEGGDVDLTIQ